MKGAAILYYIVLHSSCFRRNLFNKYDFNSRITVKNQCTWNTLSSPKQRRSLCSHWDTTAEQLLGQRLFSPFWAKPLRQLCVDYLKIQAYWLYTKIYTSVLILKQTLRILQLARGFDRERQTHPMPTSTALLKWESAETPQLPSTTKTAILKHTEFFYI